MQDNYEDFEAAINSVLATGITLFLAKYFGSKSVVTNKLGTTTIHYWRGKGYLMSFKPAEE